MSPAEAVHLSETLSVLQAGAGTDMTIEYVERTDTWRDAELHVLWGLAKQLSETDARGAAARARMTTELAGRVQWRELRGRDLCYWANALRCLGDEAEEARWELVENVQERFGVDAESVGLVDPQYWHVLARCLGPDMPLPQRRTWAQFLLAAFVSTPRPHNSPGERLRELCDLMRALQTLEPSGGDSGHALVTHVTESFYSDPIVLEQVPLQICRQAVRTFKSHLRESIRARWARAIATAYVHSANKEHWRSLEWKRNSITQDGVDGEGGQPDCCVQ